MFRPFSALLPSFFVLCLLGAGCSRVAAVQIQNPAVVGHVEPNKVVLPYARAERTYAIPAGSLNDEASLLTFEPQSVCFNVTLRNVSSDAALSDLQSYEYLLKADDQALGTAELNPQQQQVNQFQGQVPETHQTGTTEYCAYRNPDSQQCERWNTEPTYSTVYVPGIITVVTGGGNLCFANTGALGPHTQVVELQMRNIRGTGSRRNFVFEWQLVGSQVPPQG
ncbi:MAG: hypothetical protein AAGF12_38725 [Myxococcota bacterium]